MNIRHLARALAMGLVALGGNATRGELVNVARRTLGPGMLTRGEISDALRYLANRNRLAITPAPGSHSDMSNARLAWVERDDVAADGRSK